MQTAERISAVCIGQLDAQLARRWSIYASTPAGSGLTAARRVAVHAGGQHRALDISL